MKISKQKLVTFIVLAFQSNKTHSSILLILKLLEGILPTIQLLAVANFITHCTNTYKIAGSDWKVLSSLFVVIILIGLEWVIRQLCTFSKIKLELALRSNIRVKLLEFRESLKYQYIENKSTWDIISRVSKDPEIVFIRGYMSLLDFGMILIRIIGISVVVATQFWWIAAIILLTFIPLVYYSYLSGKASHMANIASTDSQRKSDYLSSILTNREYTHERTLFKYSHYVNNLWFNEAQSTRKKQLNGLLKYFGRNKFAGILCSISSVIIIATLIKPTIRGDIEIGFFMAITGNLLVLFKMATMQISFLIRELSKSKHYLLDLEEVLSLKTNRRNQSDVIDNFIFETLEFKNVSFKYPNTTRDILCHLSFRIEAGKSYAFVGENGAGKSTIIKLILGLYDDYEGEILLNGTSIRKISQKLKSDLLSVVFQDFAKYEIKYKDLLTLGHNNSNNMEILSEMKKINLDINNPDILECEIGKLDKKSFELSKGQWQKSIILRALLSNKELKILDEPTASLDPITEKQMYEDFSSLINGTSILITHRLGSTKKVDCIYLLHAGTVVEDGSHEELMIMNGAYTAMYESQRSWYR